MRQNTSAIASGVLGNSIAVNTAVASFVNTIPGRYRLWGHCRHTLVDGIKITGVPGGSIILAGGPNDTIQFGPVVFDLSTATTINIALNTATGASDTASATAYLELINH